MWDKTQGNSTRKIQDSVKRQDKIMRRRPGFQCCWKCSVGPSDLCSLNGPRNAGAVMMKFLLQTYQHLPLRFHSYVRTKVFVFCLEGLVSLNWVLGSWHKLPTVHVISVLHRGALKSELVPTAQWNLCRTVTYTEEH